jgi:hypothetical protein
MDKQPSAFAVWFQAQIGSPRRVMFRRLDDYQLGAKLDAANNLAAECHSELDRRRQWDHARQYAMYGWTAKGNEHGKEAVSWVCEKWPADSPS